MKGILALGTFLVYLLMSTESWAVIYKYVDKSGLVFYTNVPLGPKAAKVKGAATRKSAARKQAVKPAKAPVSLYANALAYNSNAPIALPAPRREATPGEVSPDVRNIEQIVHDKSRQHSMDPTLVKAIIKAESNWNPSAVSPMGAMGLMQLMPGTADLLAVSNPYDPADNIDGGIRYIKYLLSRFNGDITLALAAYNAGPGAVDKYGGVVPPYQETQVYVNRVLTAYNGKTYYPNWSVGKTSTALQTFNTRIYKVRMANGTILYTNIAPGM